MEDEEQRREEANNILNSPFYFCVKLLKSLRKCLGYDSPPTTLHQSPTPDEVETEMKINEESKTQAAHCQLTTLARGRPPRPPVSSGGGGQIN